MPVTFLSHLTPQSTLAELPAWDTRLPVTALGHEVDAALRRHPELPGVVVVDGGRVCGAISRAQFQQTISRPFGREVVGPRAVRLLLEELSPGDPLILDARTPIQEAVRQSLARVPSMLYEPLLVGVRPPADVRLVGFNDLLQADSRISILRNQQMHEILATVQEGFVLVDRDHRIASEFSRSVVTILGRADLAGVRLPDVLEELAGTELAELARGYLETLFNPNVIERLVADINPLKSVQVPERDGKGRQFLRFAFRRSMDGKEIRRILVRVEDRTREVEMAAELEEQERQAAQRVDLAMEMMQIDPEALTDYLTRFLAEIAQVRRLRTKGTNGGDPRAAIDSMFRILHGLKGEAGLIGMRSFADKLHRAEDVVQSLRESSDAEPFGMARLDASVESLLTLGSEAKDLIARLSALGGRRQVELPERPADLMTAIDRMIAELARRLGKPARFIAHWNDADLPRAYVPVLRDALVQLARNAMTHGVETEAQRHAAGKRVPAVLQVALRRHEAERQLEIVFQDDGRGLDLDRIRLRAGERFGLAWLDDEQAAQMIFEPGFSTAETTTSDAGRGVGLDLVRDRIESLGGVILVHSGAGQYCAFQIVLPLDPEGEP